MVEEKKHQEKFGQRFNLSAQSIRQREATVLKKLRYPSRSRKIKDYMNDLDSEDWNKYEGIYDEVKDNNQIVDGIKIESFAASMKKAKVNSQNEKKKSEQTEINEEIFEKGTKQYEQSLEQIRDLEYNNKSKNYLEGISELLSELDELDKMLKQTSIEIKSEKDKKQKNEALKAKMKKVEDLMQK